MRTHCRLGIIFFMLLALTACTNEASDDKNDDEDPDDYKETDTIAPLFLNLQNGMLPSIEHDANEAVDLFENIIVVDDVTETDAIELSVDKGNYAYDRPGLYTVTIHAEDGAGNVSQAHRHVLVRGDLNRYDAYDLIVEDHTIEGVPHTTHYYDDGEEKPVIFYFHGFGSDRHRGDQERGEALAGLGFHVIAIDAYLHGERADDDFDALEGAERQKKIIDIVMQTAKDARDLYDVHYLDNPLTKEGEIYAFGVSMGAATAFYLSSITDVDAMVSLLGSPSFTEFYEYKQSQYGWDENAEFLANLERFAAEDPLLHPERFEGTALYMSGGTADNVVPMEYASRLAEKLNRPDAIFKSYETGHMSTPRMLETAYYFLLGIKD